MRGTATRGGGERSEAVNANLWAGLALLAASGAFVAWARLRPVKVPPSTEDEGASDR